MNRLGLNLASLVTSGVLAVPLAIALALSLGSMPPAAAKAPGTPTLLTPAAGAVVPANPDGIPVTFDCPGFAVNQYGFENFSLAFNSTGALNSAGGLATDSRSSTARDIVFDGNRTCSATMKTQFGGADAFNDYLRPEVSGGRVYWQATSGDSTTNVMRSAVQTFVIGQPDPGEIRAPKRVYAGYTTPITFRNDAETYGAPATLERFDGASWVAIGSDTFNGVLRFFNALPRGESALRVTLALPSGPLSSPTLAVHARGNKNRVTTRRNNGTYRVSKYGGGVLFGARGSGKVVRKGRVLKGLDLQVKALCFSLSGTPPDPRIRTRFAPIRVAPNGGFAAKDVDAETGIVTEVVGRLRPDRIRISVDASKLGCTGVGYVLLTRR